MVLAVLFTIIIFLLRAYAAYFCANKATEKNRKAAGWVIASLFFPIVTMLVINSVENATTWHTND